MRRHSGASVGLARGQRLRRALPQRPAAIATMLAQLAEQRLARAEAAQLDHLVQAQRRVEHQALGMGDADQPAKPRSLTLR